MRCSQARPGSKIKYLSLRLSTARHSALHNHTKRMSFSQEPLHKSELVRVHCKCSLFDSLANTDLELNLASRERESERAKSDWGTQPAKRKLPFWILSGPKTVHTLRIHPNTAKQKATELLRASKQVFHCTNLFSEQQQKRKKISNFSAGESHIAAVSARRGGSYCAELYSSDVLVGQPKKRGGGPPETGGEPLETSERKREGTQVCAYLKRVAITFSLRRAGECKVCRLWL